MEHSKSVLKGVELFDGIEDDVIDATSALCSVKRFNPEEVIFTEGDASEGVCFLVEGSVRASIFTLTGKNVVFQDILPGKMFGEIAALDGSPRSATIEAIVPSKVAFLSTSTFIKLMSDNSEIMLRVFNILAEDVRRLSARVVEFSTLTVHNRIHAELLRLAGGENPDQTRAVINPNPTLADIANRISTHREAVSREISRLTKAGLLKREKGSLIITDLGRLSKMVRDAVGE